MSSTKKKQTKCILACGVILLALLGCGWWALLCPFSKSKDKFIYIYPNDNIETIYQRLDSIAGPGHMETFMLLSHALKFKDHIHPGKYDLKGLGTWALLQNFRHGHQATIAYTIPPVNLPETLAAKMGKVFAADSATFAKAFLDSALLKKYGMSTQTLFCYIIPDTYDIYWNVSPEGFLERMKKETERFWTDKRKEQAKATGLTTEEVITLASIVEKETLSKEEKPIIAGLYLNRLKKDMKLQACPTAIYANRVFGVHRVIDAYLKKDDPYNTYIYNGLPPGPICIPSKETIEAVLNFDHNDYLYMCAKEDFSGRHNFAATGKEHMENAARYANALNKRGINK